MVSGNTTALMPVWAPMYAYRCLLVRHTGACLLRHGHSAKKWACTDCFMGTYECLKMPVSAAYRCMPAQTLLHYPEMSMHRVMENRLFA